MKESFIHRAFGRRTLESRDSASAETALREFDEQIRQSPNPVDKAGLFLDKAVLSGTLLRFDDARKNLELALAAAPQEPGIRISADFIAASLFDQEGNPERAFEELTAVLCKYRKRLTDEPALRFMYEDIQQRRALDLAQVHRFEEAVPLLEECLLFDLERPIRSVFLANLGLCYSQLKRYGDAKGVLLKAQELGVPKEWEGQVHCSLGIAYAHLGLLRESKKELQICEQNAVEYHLPMRPIYGWLRNVCERLGEKAESEQYARLARPV